MAVGEGGPELVKQLLGKTYDVARPEVVLVWLENAPVPAWARRTSPSPSSAPCSRTASSRTGSWNSPAPAWRAFPWNTAAASTS